MVFNKISSSPQFPVSRSLSPNPDRLSEPCDLFERSQSVGASHENTEDEQSGTNSPNRSPNDSTKAEFYIGDDLFEDSILSHVNNKENSFHLLKGQLTNKKEINEKDAKPEFVAPDGGYGWVIALSACVVNIFIVGFIKSYGVLYISIMNRFPNTSAYHASWLPVFLATIGLLIAPITGILCRKFTSQRVSFFGGVLIFLGLMLGAFANSMTGMIFSVGLLTGIGAGLTTIPGVLITSLYFEKRRSLASAICISGNAIGGFVFPPLLDYCLASFELTGTLCIVAALQLHICAVSLLYRPITVHALIQQRQRNKNIYLPKEESEYFDTTTVLKHDTPHLPKLLPSRLISNSTNDNEEMRRQVSFLRSSSMLNSIPDLTEYARSWSIEQGSTGAKHGDEADLKGSIISLSPPSNLEVLKRIAVRENQVGSLGLIRKSDKELDVSSTPLWNRKLMSLPELDDDASISLNDSCDNDFTKISVEGPINAMGSPNKRYESVRVNEETPTKLLTTNFHSNKVVIQKQKGISSNSCCTWIDCSLLSNSIFWLVAISVTLVASGAPHAMFFMPAYAASVDIDNSAIISLMSTTSLIDLTARLGMGFLSDLNIVHSGYIYAFTLVSSHFSEAER